MSERPIEVATAAQPTASVIWLHGLGADGNDFVPVIPELALPASLAIRFVFPHAPRRPVTWSGGAVMRAWYDIESVDEGKRHVDEADLLAARDTVRQLIAAENARGVPTERIVVAGFSQGGAIAYTAGLTHTARLAGVVALSTYIPLPALIERDWAAHNDAVPVFAAHGREDGVVPYALGERARDLVVSKGGQVDWHAYPIAHSVNLDELRAIGTWLARRFAA